MAYCCIAKPWKAKLCSYSHCQNYYRRARIICDIHIFATPEKGPIFQSETPMWWRVTFLFLSLSAADTESCIFQNPLGWHSRLNFCNSINETPTLSSQKSRESNTSLVTSARHHLHALLCESGGGWHLANCVHLFQLLSTVFSGEIMINNTVWQWPEFESSH